MVTEMNILRSGAHFFKVEIKDDYLGCHTKEVYEELKVKFPEPEYKITTTRWETIGKEVTL